MLELWREPPQKIILDLVGDPEHQHSGQVDPLGLTLAPAGQTNAPFFFDFAENEVGQPDFAYEVTMPQWIGAGTLGVPRNLGEGQADDEHRTHWSVWSLCTIEAAF